MAQVTKGSFNTEDYGGRYLTFSWEKTSHSSSGCYTDIKWTLKGAGGGTNNYYYAGSFKLVIDGDTVYTSATRIQLFNGTEVASGTKRIYHANNGTKSFSAYTEMAIYYKTINATGEDSWELPTIPRYATVSHNLSSNDENNITMTWSSDSTCDGLWYSTNGGSSWTGVSIGASTSGRYTIGGLIAGTKYNIKTRVRRKDSQLTTDSSNFVVTTYDYPHCTNSPDFIIGSELTLSIYNPLKREYTLIIEGANGKTKEAGLYKDESLTGFNHESWVDWLYSTIPANTNSRYKVHVKYNNVTKTRDNGNTYGINASACQPEFENFEYFDNNSAVTDILGSNQFLVKNKSVLVVEIPSGDKMKIKRWAEPEKYTAYLDTLSGDIIYSTSDTFREIGTPVTAGTLSLRVTAYDSRGNGKSVNKDVIIFDHDKPIINLDVSRLNNFEDTTTLSINGTYNRIVIDNVDKNTIKSVQYRYREVGGEWSSYTTAKTTVTAGKFTCNDITLSLDNTKSFEFEVIATDNFDTGNTGGIVDIGEAIFFISTNKKTCYINGEEVAIKKDVIAKNTYQSGLDLNDINDTCFYYVNGGSNKPIANNGFVFTQYLNNNYKYQTFTVQDSGNIYKRVCSNGTWTKWEPMINRNYIEGRVYSGQSVAKQTSATIQYKPINTIGTGISLTNGVITINDDSIRLISINAGSQNTNWTTGGMNMYLYKNGTNQATNVIPNTINGVLNATIPVIKGDQIEVKIYGDVAIKLENSPWSYLNVLAM